MGMMGMGTSLFQDENMSLARTYWYLIVGVLGLLLTVRAANHIQRRRRYAAILSLLSCACPHFLIHIDLIQIAKM